MFMFVWYNNSKQRSVYP